MSEKKTLVYLADLTHTGQIVASNTHPLGIGLIGAYCLDKLGDWVEVELFKYPEDLANALEERMPEIIGFANYSWNSNLGHEFAKRIKNKSPETVVVFGGPNYGLAREEQIDFWHRHPLIDFYVLKEGEAAMVYLIQALEKYHYDARALMRAKEIVPSCHYFFEGELVAGPLLPRFKSLEEIRSPYLMGIMDKFFDSVLIPMTHSTRGCPFTCTFCQEGISYYAQVAKRSVESFEKDLNYMGERVGPIRDVIFSDANFGMFKEDIEKARAIARVQDKYHWPIHVHVSGGKNQKERLLEVASIIHGAMKVAAALQSTDKSVLENVKRKNISLEQLYHVGKQGQRIDADTYAEIILALPGDSLEAHTNSLRDATNAGICYLRMYQLITLLETDMNTPETRSRFGMETKWRVMPRCFGSYELFGEKFSCCEVEEICVALNTLPFEDYLECRELDLTVEITHNVNIFRELFGLSRRFKFSWFDFLLRFHNKRRSYGQALAGLYDTFREDTIKPLWDSREALLTYAESHVARYILDELGTNELFKGKAIAFFRLQEELHEALYSEMESLLKEMGHWNDSLALYLKELQLFSKYRKKNLLDTAAEYEADFHYDFRAIMEQDFDVRPDEVYLEDPLRYVFNHNQDQKQAMNAYIGQYGTAVVGLGRILLRAHVKRLFRNFQINGAVIHRGDEKVYERSLNLYGD